MENRFFRLGELAEEVGGQVFGDPELALSSMTSLELAGPEDLSFLRDPAQVALASQSKAIALLVPLGVRVPGKSLLEVEDPALAAAQLARKFSPPAKRPAGIHPTAVVEDGAVVSPKAHVGPYVVVGAGSVVEAGVELHPGVVVGRACQIGADSILFPHAVLYDGTRLGPETILHAGVVLGSDGFGYVSRGSTHHKVPQIGRVVVEAEVEIGANTAIDRGTFGETRIGAGSKIDNLVQVGHNVTTGKACMLCGQSGIAGSARLGHGVVLAGQAGSAGHLTIGDGVQVAAKGAVLQTVEKGQKVGGIPAVELRQWQRQVFGSQKLPEILRRLRALEKALARQEEE
ncbi:MAG: UDP-3-O-(3-hydroxymyristoyl)glucosamine N-acyltransferase [Deltaproteobacteria bacterium]|nr:UDP-3-O-(3-hydroxymyristoyl)glucosamine N-acyltransferase [Deltaproteobacteria bacterium]